VFLTSLRLLHFKNYESVFLQFNHPFILFSGLNGSGKTNLLDAIYYLCMCKSYFSASDKLARRFNSEFFRLDGVFTEGDRSTEISVLYQNGRKEIYRNSVPYTRLADHIGQFPVAVIAPDDVGMIQGSSEERRRFMDAAIAQWDPAYLQILITYNRLLQQRNAIFRQAQEGLRVEEALIGIINHQLAEAGEQIHKTRTIWLASFSPIFHTFYHTLGGGKEDATIQYRSQLDAADMLSLLLRTERDDRAVGRTTTGIHRDDLFFSLDGNPIRDTGSQGQIKTFLIALKLAQGKLLHNSDGRSSLLLLDDVFEKLDRQRLELLFEILQTPVFTQVFITDADTDRSAGFLSAHVPAFEHVQIDNGKIL